MRTTRRNNAAGVTVDVRSARRHWLFGIVARAGLRHVEKLVLDRETAIADAWAEVCKVCRVKEEVLAKSIADHFRLHVADLNTAEARPLKLIPENIAHRLQVYPMRENDRELVVATSDPTNLEAEEALGFASGRKPVFEVAPPAALKEAIDAAYRPDAALENLLAGIDADITGTVDVVNADAPERVADGTTTLSEVERALGDKAEQPLTDAAGDSDATRILVVDDDAVTRKLARVLLEKNGFEVSEAEDGEAALEHLSSEGSCDLMILDLNMPRLDGRGVLQRVRADVATAGLPVVVLTGSVRDEAEVTLMEEGADDYICKPIDPPLFVARVKATLRRAGA